MVTNQIIELLQLTHLSGIEQETILKKIVSDGLLLSRAQTLSLNAYLVEAVRQLHPLEKERLIKRCGPSVTSNKATPATWSIATKYETMYDDGKPVDTFAYHVLQAKCPACRDSGPRWQSPQPYASLRSTQVESSLSKLTFFHACTRQNETAPPDILERWREILSVFVL
jgi:hypothetical protein